MTHNCESCQEIVVQTNQVRLATLRELNIFNSLIIERSESTYSSITAEVLTAVDKILSPSYNRPLPLALVQELTGKVHQLSLEAKYDEDVESLTIIAEDYQEAVKACITALVNKELCTKIHLSSSH